MENKPKPNDINALLAFVWLLVGLTPIVVYLVLFDPHGPRLKWLDPVFLFVVCALCNLLGGFGCVRNIKNIGVRIVSGLVLAVFFFVLSWAIAIFQACSHSPGI